MSVYNLAQRVLTIGLLPLQKRATRVQTRQMREWMRKWQESNERMTNEFMNNRLYIGVFENSQ